MSRRPFARIAAPAALVAVISAMLVGSAAAAGTSTFSGVVRDRNGDPLPFQRLSLSGGGFTINGSTGADGSFSLNAAPGLYTLQLDGNRTVFAPGPFPLPITIATLPNSYTVTGIQIDLRNGDRQQDLRLPTLFLDIDALDPTGHPLANANLELRQSFPGPSPGPLPMPPSTTINTQIELFPGGTGTAFYSNSKPSDTGGHARLALLAADNLVLAITPPPTSGLAPFLEQLGSISRDTSITVPRPTTPPDTSPPAIVPQVSGAAGDGDWYTGDVSVSWSVTDPESGVASSTGCGATAITTDTGGTSVTCSARNAAGLSASRSVTVKRDTGAATIEHAVAPAAPDGANGWYVTAPAVTFSCADATSGVASCRADGGSGASSTLGEAAGAQTVGGTARDRAGNESHDRVEGVRVDLNDPVVSCDGTPTFVLGQSGARVSATVTDAASGALDSSVTTAADTSGVGTFSVRLSGRDRAGRTGTSDCGYAVVYDWTGFAAPVARTGMTRRNAGSVVPLRFSLVGNQGLDVLAPGYPQSAPVPCDGSASGPVDAATSPGASGLSYDAATDSYTWLWKTDGSWAGTCRQVVVKLRDGTSHSVTFDFR